MIILISFLLYFCRCHADLRKPNGKYVFDFCGALLCLMTALDAIFYLAIWWEIKGTSSLIKKSSSSAQFQGRQSVCNNDQSKYANTAKMLILFVVAYFAQWWPLVLLSAWSYVAPPPVAITILVVIFVNAGGVYNCLAYTVIRRRLQVVSAGSKDGSSSGASQMTNLSKSLHAQ